VGRVLLLCAYGLAAFFPVVSLGLHATPDDSFLYLAGRGLGLTGLSMLLLLVPLGTRLPLLDRVFGLDVVVRFHKRTAMLAGACILTHPCLLAWDAESAWLFSLEPGWDIRLGQIGLLVLLAVIVSALGFRLIRMDYGTWRFLHKGSIVVIGLGLAHAWQSGTSFAEYPEVRAHAWGLAGLAVLCFLYANLYVPWFGRRPFAVRSVRREAEDATTLCLEAADGRPFVRQAGQFLFLKIRGPGFPREEHPFTVASSPRESVAVTIKALGDYTRRIPEVQAGWQALVSGPFGNFTLERHAPPAFLFVAGGVGITPIMSMLRFLRDTADTRPAVLLYASRTASSILFRQELDALAPRVRVVHVLSQPGVDWRGEIGHICAELIQRQAEDILASAHAYVCGPPAMMTAVARQLRTLGLARRRIHTERFGF